MARGWKSFLGVAGEGIDKRECSKFEEGLNSNFRCIGLSVSCLWDCLVLEVPSCWSREGSLEIHM